MTEFAKEENNQIMIDKAKKRFKELNIDSSFMDKININRTDSLWYGGEVLSYVIPSFTKDGVTYDSYEITLNAYGDVIGWGMYNNTEFRFKDRQNFGTFETNIPSHINTDDILNEFVNRGYENKEDCNKIVLEYGNWYEVTIRNLRTDSCGVSDGIDTLDFLVEVLDVDYWMECIVDYYKVWKEVS